MFQNSSDVEGGEKPAELHGAPQREVGGECLRGGRAPLLHRAGAAHLAPREVESHASGDPQEAPRHLPRAGGVTRWSQQVCHCPGAAPVPVTLEPLGNLWGAEGRHRHFGKKADSNP